MKTIIAISFLIVSTLSLATNTPPTYSNYHNSEFNYDLSYPKSWFDLEKKFDKTKGFQFETKNKSVIVLVYGSKTYPEVKLEKLSNMKEYSLYKHIVLHPKKYGVLEIYYLPKEKPKWDPIFKQMIKSFHFVDGV